MLIEKNFNYRLFIGAPTLGSRQSHLSGQETAMSHPTAEHDRQRDAQVCAFNTAFADLGLRFRWDARTLDSLAAIAGEHARVAAYIEAHHPHLLKAYSKEFLCEAILARKNAQAPGEWPLAQPAQRARAMELPAMAAVMEQDWREGGLPALAGA
jgi:hypothetical protein